MKCIENGNRNILKVITIPKLFPMSFKILEQT